MGRWIDFENDYKTMDRDFMESVWHAFKRMWDDGLIYEGRKVLPYSWRLSTPLSNSEASLNYMDTQDPSVTIVVRTIRSLRHILFSLDNDTVDITIKPGNLCRS